MENNDLGLLLKNENFTTIFVKEKTNVDTNKLLNEVNTAIKSNVITQFGLSKFYEEGMFKEGGSVTTVHNARKAVFANEEDKLRFNRSYNRKDYEKRYEDDKSANFSEIRKQKFNNEEKIIDIYTGKELTKDGQSHLDHIVSAKEIHDDDTLRLYTTKEEMANIATSDDNLGFTHASINQSKGEHNLKDWMYKTKKGQLKNNKDRYEIDEKITIKQNENSRKSLKKQKITKVTKDVTQKVSKEALKRGGTLVKKQVVGILIAETSSLVYESVYPVVEKWNTYSSLKDRISEISKRMKASFKNGKEKLLNLIKRLIQGASSAFAGSIVSIIFETVINSFLTTTAKFGKLLNDSVASIIQAFQIVFSNDSDISNKEKVREGIKVIGAALVTSLSLITSQVITETIKSNPSNPLFIFAEEIGTGIGIILTGFLVPTFIFTVENFGEITKEIRNVFSLIKYGATITAGDIEKEFQQIEGKIDDAYHQILNSIYIKYKNMNKLHDMVDDYTSLANEQFGNSVAYAQAWGVSETKILKDISDIDKFFLE